MIHNAEFQEFVKKLGGSQHVNIDMDETNGMISISGKKTAVDTSRTQIRYKILKLSSLSMSKTPIATDSIESSVAKNDFLEHFGQNILNVVRKEPGINSAHIVNGKLQLSGNNAAITKIKYYLEQSLYEKSVSVTYSMKQHLQLAGKGRMLKEFAKKYHVGTSLQELRLHNKNKCSKTPNKDCPSGHGFHTGRGLHTNHGGHNLGPNRSQQNDNFGHNQGRRGYPRYNPRRGQRGRGRYNSKSTEYEDAENHDHDDDNNSQASDSDESLSSNFSIDTRKSFNARAQQSLAIELCSDSEVSLSNAIAELQSYSLHLESWTLTEEQVTFILKQQQQGKPPQKYMSIIDRSKKIKFYLLESGQNPFVHFFTYYAGGMWHVKASGFKSDVHHAIFKIKSYLNAVVETEVQIPISNAMAFFLRRKVFSDINRLGKIHNTKIIIFSQPRNAGNTNEGDNDNHCLKLVGAVSRINLAQIEVQNFLESLSEQEENFPCDTWDLSRNISKSILTCLKKVQDSDDYEAIGLVKFFELAIERRQTTPKITFTVVGLNKETTDDVIQQCKDIIEGYIIWKPSLDEYLAISNTLLVKKRPHIDHFKQEWNTNIQLESQTSTVIIPARSKTIADEIKEALQNLAAGINRMDRISVTIPIQFTIRRLVYQAIQPLLNEVKAQKVFIDSKNQAGLTLHGGSQVINSIQEKINTIINDVKQKIVTNRLKLPFVESELIRANSYQVAKRIEHETNTIIRDVRIDGNISKSNKNDDNDDTSITITCVVNDRGQTILVKKGDITKVKDVDSIVNAANGPLYHAGGVDKAISDAAGCALDQECKQLIANNGGVAIPTGKAVKTTAGRLPYKSVIHAIGPQYFGGYQQERPLLFSSILSSLQLAEQERYKSIALPAISAATYGFPLQDCTNIVIRAVKQFFADFPESHLRKVILLDIDDAACNSFAREVVNDHTNATADKNDDIMNYNLPPLTAKWCWQDDDREKIYDESHTRLIEAAFQQFLQTFIPSTLKINCDNLSSAAIVCYSIHFYADYLKQILTTVPNALDGRCVCGYQMRESTNFARHIIRYPLTSQTHNTSVAYRPKPLDVYHLQVQSKEDDWDITGISSVAIKQAEMAIRKTIASATISEPFSVNLNDDIDAHKKAITNIAIQQFIHVDFQQNSTGNLSIILKGFQQNVLQAKLQISLYVQEILMIEADKDDDLDIPKEWGEQEEQCKLVDLPKHHPDFIRIEKRMKETLSNVKIDKIERIQNLRIWNHYAFRRQTLQKELSNKPNLQIEMELFHGTRATLPSEVYNGEFGFDMTFCTSGLWGLGSYFAMNASYSCSNYSYELPNGKRQVFLAQVLTGEAIDYKNKNDSSLRRPPKKNEAISGERYNSVSGETGGSKVYIVYENRVVYPTFLITFNQ